MPFSKIQGKLKPTLPTSVRVGTLTKEALLNYRYY